MWRRGKVECCIINRYMKVIFRLFSPVPFTLDQLVLYIINKCVLLLSE